MEDNGMWAYLIIAIVFICFIMALILILNAKKKKKKSKLIIILIIVLLFPSIQAILGLTLNMTKEFSYANVKNLDYKIEQINNHEFNIYFFDKNNNYYQVKQQAYTQNFESEVYLHKSGKEERVGLHIDVLHDRTTVTKLYMKDYRGNKVLVWDSSNY